MRSGNVLKKSWNSYPDIGLDHPPNLAGLSQGFLEISVLTQLEPAKDCNKHSPTFKISMSVKSLDYDQPGWSHILTVCRTSEQTRLLSPLKASL